MDARRGAATRRSEMAQRPGDEKTERARADDGDDVAGGDRRTEHGVHRTGHGLDGDRVRVTEGIGHGIELAGVRHEAGTRPATTGVGAEARLEAGADVAEGDVPAVADLSGLAGGAQGLIPRAAQPSTGCSTTRLPAGRTPPSAPVASSASVPTTSWPGTKGKETMSSK